MLSHVCGRIETLRRTMHSRLQKHDSLPTSLVYFHLNEKDACPQLRPWRDVTRTDVTCVELYSIRSRNAWMYSWPDLCTPPDEAVERKVVLLKSSRSKKSLFFSIENHLYLWCRMKMNLFPLDDCALRKSDRAIKFKSKPRDILQSCLLRRGSTNTFQLNNRHLSLKCIICDYSYFLHSSAFIFVFNKM